MVVVLTAPHPGGTDKNTGSRAETRSGVDCISGLSVRVGGRGGREGGTGSIEVLVLTVNLREDPEAGVNLHRAELGDVEVEEPVRSQYKRGCNLVA